jgi:hypothetical protein
MMDSMVFKTHWLGRVVNSQYLGEGAAIPVRIYYEDSELAGVAKSPDTQMC